MVYFLFETLLFILNSLSFPFFSLLEKYLNTINQPIIIGFSGLPGSGKSTLGFWIDNVAKELSLDIKVISLDDFYYPGEHLQRVMKGNPWNVPRALPGSHDIELLEDTISKWIQTGKLLAPQLVMMDRLTEFGFPVLGISIEKWIENVNFAI